MNGTELANISDQRKLIQTLIDAKFATHFLRDNVTELCEWLFTCIDLTIERVDNGGTYIIQDHSRFPDTMIHFYKGEVKYRSMSDYLNVYFAEICIRLPDYLAYGPDAYLQIVDNSVCKSGGTNDCDEITYVTLSHHDIKRIVLDIQTFI